MLRILTQKTVKSRALLTALCVISAVILPQIFHAIGAVSGVGTAVGSALLPMHIPVILAGIIGGPAAGLITGVVSPVLSFAISGMPSAVVLPFMTLELAAYGACSGFLAKTEMNSFLQILIVQLSGRAVRALAVLFAVYALGYTAVTVSSILTMVTTGLFGIVIQWALIPLIQKFLKTNE
ncbi:MAG: ECF transporter S component [Acutalibacteraceae bacterium]